MADLKIVLTVVDKATGQVRTVRRSLQELEGPAAAADNKLGMLQRTLGGFTPSKLMGLGLAGITVGALVGKLGDASNAASDLNETINKTRAVFGSASDAMLAFGDTARQALGMTKQEALEAAGSLGNMFLSAELAQEQAAVMSRNVVRLAADLASFNNEDPSAMLDKLRSGLAGEAEPLRRYGVLLSEAAVAQKAVDAGLVENVKSLTEADKVLARYLIIVEQTKTAQGDFARTANDNANAARRLDAALGDLSTRIGGQLLPVQKEATNLLADLVEGLIMTADANEQLRPRIRELVKEGKDYNEAVDIAVREQKAFNAAARDGESALEALNLQLGKTITQLPDVAAEARSAADALDELQDKLAYERAMGYDKMPKQWEIDAGVRWDVETRDFNEATEEALRRRDDRIEAEKRAAEAAARSTASAAERAANEAERAANEAERAFTEGLRRSADAASEAVQGLRRALDSVLDSPLLGSQRISRGIEDLQGQIAAAEYRAAQMRRDRAPRSELRRELKGLAGLRGELDLLELEQRATMTPAERQVERALNPLRPEMSVEEKIAAGLALSGQLAAAESVDAQYNTTNHISVTVNTGGSAEIGASSEEGRVIGKQIAKALEELFGGAGAGVQVSASPAIAGAR